MSFYYDNRVAYPVVTPNYIPQESVQDERRLQWWHIALLLISLIMASVGLFARLVLSNLKQVNSEVTPHVTSTVPSIPSAPATLPLQVPQSSQTSEQSKKLQADIDAWLKTHANAHWAVDVHQLDGDLSASSKADESFHIASLYKLFLLQALANKVPSSGWDAKVSERSYKDCVDLMLRLSDNPCAEAIGSRLGWTYVDKFNQSLGYGNTRLSVGDAIGTAGDTTKVLQNLYDQNGFDPLARQQELASLAAPKKVEAIRGACIGCTVYNKVGYIDGYKHDAAIVQKNGRVYSVVILTQGSSWKLMSDLTTLIQNYF